MSSVLTSYNGLNMCTLGHYDYRSENIVIVYVAGGRINPPSTHIWYSSFWIALGWFCAICEEHRSRGGDRWLGGNVDQPSLPKGASSA